MIKFQCGNCGSGKTNIITQQAMKEMKKGRPVYSNYPISFIHRNKEYRSIKLDKYMLANYTFPKHSLIIIDEAGHWFNSRDFKNFSKEELIFFTVHRHIAVDVILIAQHPQRVDTIVREIGNVYYENVAMFGSVEGSIGETLRRIFPFGIVYRCYQYEDYGVSSKAYKIVRRKRKTFLAYDTTYEKYKIQDRDTYIKIWDVQPIKDSISLRLLDLREFYLNVRYGKYKRTNPALDDMIKPIKKV